MALSAFPHGPLPPLASTSSSASSSSRPSLFRNPWSGEDLFVAPALTRSGSGGPSTPPPSRIPVKASPRTPPTGNMDDRPRRSHFLIGSLPPRKASLKTGGIPASPASSRVVQSHGVEFEIAGQPQPPSIGQILSNAPTMQRHRSASEGGDLTLMRSRPASPARAYTSPMRRVASDETIPAILPLPPVRAATPSRPPMVRNRTPVAPANLLETPPRRKVSPVHRSPRPDQPAYESDLFYPSPPSSATRYAHLPASPCTPSSNALTSLRTASASARRPFHSPSQSNLSSPNSSDGEQAPFSPIQRPRRQRGTSNNGSIGGRSRTESHGSSRSGTPNRMRTSSGPSPIVAVGFIDGAGKGGPHQLGSVGLPTADGATILLRCSAPVDMEMKTVYTVSTEGTPCMQYEIRLRPISVAARPFTPPPSQHRRPTVASRRPTTTTEDADFGADGIPATPRQGPSTESESPSPSEEPMTPRRSQSPAFATSLAALDDSPLAGKGVRAAGGLGLADVAFPERVVGPAARIIPPTPGEWHGYDGYLSEAYGNAASSPPATAPATPVRPTVPSTPTKTPTSAMAKLTTSPLAKRRMGSVTAGKLFLGLEGLQLMPYSPPASNDDETMLPEDEGDDGRRGRKEISHWSETETEEASDGGGLELETPAEVTRAFFATDV